MQMEQMPDYENDKDVLQKFGRNINEEVKKGKMIPSSVVMRKLEKSLKY